MYSSGPGTVNMGDEQVPRHISDSIDERLLDYVDEDDDFRLEVVKRLHYYASTILEVPSTREPWPKIGPIGST